MLEHGRDPLGADATSAREEVVVFRVGDNYVSVFSGCLAELPGLCLTFKTYLSTLKFCVLAWALTLVLGFTVAYFLAFHVCSLTAQMALFLLAGGSLVVAGVHLLARRRRAAGSLRRQLTLGVGLTIGLVTLDVAASRC